MQLYQQLPNPANPARNLARAGLGQIFKNGQIPDLSGNMVQTNNITLITTRVKTVRSITIYHIQNAMQRNMQTVNTPT